MAHGGKGQKRYPWVQEASGTTEGYARDGKLTARGRNPTSQANRCSRITGHPRSAPGGPEPQQDGEPGRKWDTVARPAQRHFGAASLPVLLVRLLVYNEEI